MSRLARGAVRIPAWIRTVWLMFGIYLVLLVALEACSSVWARYALPREDPYDESNADALADADWVDGYLRELRRIDPAWHSYVYWKREPFQGEYFNIDAQGRRRTRRSPALGSGGETPTLFVHGASTVWGRGARDEFTIPSWLAKVMGLAPYGEPRYVKAIYDHIIDLKPDGSFRLDLDY